MLPWGGAAESLSGLANHFVCLPIPKISCIDSSSVFTCFDGIDSALPASIVSQQCIIGDFDCHAVLVVSDNSVRELAECSRRAFDSESEKTQLLQELFTTINDTCFDRMGEFFETVVIQHLPVVEATHICPSSFDFTSIVHSPHVVAVDIHYSIESHPFYCHLLLLFPESEVGTLVNSLDQLLNG